MRHLGTSYYAKFYLESGKVFESDNFENKTAMLCYVDSKLEFFKSMQGVEYDSEAFSVLKVEIYSCTCFVKNIKKGD